ncbi:MAG: hypothetical protein KTR14_06725 [Vampirovibrio sp.]|nr:hypothetical protein [Vampirovibrio sp.]
MSFDQMRVFNPFAHPALQPKEGYFAFPGNPKLVLPGSQPLVNAANMRPQDSFLQRSGTQGSFRTAIAQIEQSFLQLNRQYSKSAVEGEGGVLTSVVNFFAESIGTENSRYKLQGRMKTVQNKLQELRTLAQEMETQREMSPILVARFNSVYQQLTGKDMFANDANLLQREFTPESLLAKASQKIADYETSQRSSRNLVADIGIGLGMGALMLAGMPLVSAALWAGGVGAAAKIGLKWLDTQGNRREYTGKDVLYDGATGGIIGAMAPVATAVGSLFAARMAVVGAESGSTFISRLLGGSLMKVDKGTWYARFLSRKNQLHRKIAFSNWLPSFLKRRFTNLRGNPNNLAPIPNHRVAIPLKDSVGWNRAGQYAAFGAGAGATTGGVISASGATADTLYEGGSMGEATVAGLKGAALGFTTGAILGGAGGALFSPVFSKIKTPSMARASSVQRSTDFKSAVPEDYYNQVLKASLRPDNIDMNGNTMTMFVRSDSYWNPSRIFDRSLFNRFLFGRQSTGNFIDETQGTIGYALKVKVPSNMSEAAYLKQLRKSLKDAEFIGAEKSASSLFNQNHVGKFRLQNNEVIQVELKKIP